MSANRVLGRRPRVGRPAGIACRRSGLDQSCRTAPHRQVRGLLLALGAAAVLALSGCISPSYVDRGQEQSGETEVGGQNGAPNHIVRASYTQENGGAQITARDWSAGRARYAVHSPVTSDLQSTMMNLVVYQTHKAYEETPPQCVAVLPFKSTLTGSGEQAVEREQLELVRRAFYGQLAPQSKRDIELSRIDFVLAEMAEPDRDDYRLVGRQLACDSLLVGTVLSYGSNFFGLYSRVAVGAEVRLVRVEDGVVLWEGRHVAQSHGGEIPISPVGLVLSVLNAFTNMREEQIYRVTNDLAWRLVNTIPDNGPLDPDQAYPAGKPDTDEQLLVLKNSPNGDFRRVTARALNLRAGPGTNYPVRRKLRRHDLVRIVGTPMNLGFVPVATIDGQVGFVAANYLSD